MGFRKFNFKDGVIHISYDGDADITEYTDYNLNGELYTTTELETFDFKLVVIRKPSDNITDYNYTGDSMYD